MDIESLRLAVKYDPDTGVITWNRREGTGKDFKRWNSRYEGTKAFGFVASSGHMVGRFKGKHVKAHRAAWAVFYGCLPDAEIDHINGNPSDNRICNLRAATRTQNAQNVPKRKGGLSKYRGVSKFGNRWQAAINADKQRLIIGRFQTQEEAAIAYDLFAPFFHGEFARTNIVNDKPAVTAFIEGYAIANHRTKQMDGVRSWSERVAF